MNESMNISEKLPILVCTEKLEKSVVYRIEPWN